MMPRPATLPEMLSQVDRLLAAALWREMIVAETESLLSPSLMTRYRFNKARIAYLAAVS